MAVMTTSKFIKLMLPGINKIFGMSYETDALIYPRIFKKIKSKQNFEQMQQVVGLQVAQKKAEGAPTLYDTMTQGYFKQIKPATYSTGFIVTREEIEDNLYPTIVPQRAAALRRSMELAKEIDAADVFNNGFDTDYTGYDGQPLFSATHPYYGGGGTFSNIANPAVELSEGALETMLIQIMNFTDDRGNRIAVMPKQLIVPVALQFDAKRIVYSDLRSGTGNNDINVMKNDGMLQDIVINKFLTDDDAFYVQTDVDAGFVHVERIKDGIEEDTDFDSDNAKFKARGRSTSTFVDPRCAVGSAGA